ncbi:uncharacterized protein LOC119274662 [Triticum dicoccoides]|uniref:uncharacterized protein LOC119274662 n=1 Tax=Triticum dicoccoides TaxID=85692 RepID=UPI00189050E0|nr:uncharacterized protein LOC119274662 [Triticum dicoccoides]
MMGKRSLEKNIWLELEREGFLLLNGLDQQGHRSTLGWTYYGEKLVWIARDSTWTKDPLKFHNSYFMTRSSRTTRSRTRSFPSSTLLAWTCRDRAKRAVIRTTTGFTVAVAIFAYTYIFESKRRHYG